MTCGQQSWISGLKPSVYLKLHFSYPHGSFRLLRSMCLQILSVMAVRISGRFQTKAFSVFLPSFGHLTLHWEKDNVYAVKEKWLLKFLPLQNCLSSVLAPSMLLWVSKACCQQMLQWDPPLLKDTKAQQYPHKRCVQQIWDAAPGSRGFPPLQMQELELAWSFQAALKAGIRNP